MTTNDTDAIRRNYQDINRSFNGVDNPTMVLSNHFDVLDLCDEIEAMRAQREALVAEVRKYADICARGSGSIVAADVAWKLRQILDGAS